MTCLVDIPGRTPFLEGKQRNSGFGGENRGKVMEGSGGSRNCSGDLTYERKGGKP